MSVPISLVSFAHCARDDSLLHTRTAATQRGIAALLCNTRPVVHTMHGFTTELMPAAWYGSLYEV